MPMTATVTVSCDFPGCNENEIGYCTFGPGDAATNPKGWRTIAIYNEGDDDSKPSWAGSLCPAHADLFQSTMVSYQP